ncbi:YesL family protein [Streptococcus hongkongensis]|nr:membrane protein [Streptococcus uberis]
MSGLEKLFYTIWKMMQLTLIFHVLCLSGLILFGIGPAWQTIISLYFTSDVEAKNYSIKTAFDLWKDNFKRANGYFLSLLLVLCFLAINLHLAIQLQGLIFFCLTFIIGAVMVFFVLLYLYVSLYDVLYDIAIWDNIKLAFISLFFSFRKLLELLASLVITIAVTWKFKGLFLFLSFGLFVFVLDYVSKSNRKIVDDMTYDN